MKLKYIEISTKFLMDLLKAKVTFSDTNLPKDTILIRDGFHFGAERDVVYLIVHSESFEDIPEAGVIPRFSVICHVSGRRR